MHKKSFLTSGCLNSHLLYFRHFFSGLLNSCSLFRVYYYFEIPQVYHKTLSLLFLLVFAKLIYNQCMCKYVQSFNNPWKVPEKFLRCSIASTHFQNLFLKKKHRSIKTCWPALRPRFFRRYSLHAPSCIIGYCWGCLLRTCVASCGTALSWKLSIVMSSAMQVLMNWLQFLWIWKNCFAHIIMREVELILVLSPALPQAEEVIIETVDWHISISDEIFSEIVSN